MCQLPDDERMFAMMLIATEGEAWIPDRDGAPHRFVLGGLADDMPDLMEQIKHATKRWDELGHAPAPDEL